MCDYVHRKTYSEKKKIPSPLLRAPFKMMAPPELLACTLAVSVGTGIVVAVCVTLIQQDACPSIRRNEQGVRNPMLPWWVALSLVHVGILFTWALFLQWLGCIRLREEFLWSDPWWLTLLLIIGYWVHFEAFYWVCHRSQHMFPCVGRLTGHRGEMSSKLHHGMRPPYGPDLLTAFSAHPMDSFVVQLSAQMPWITTTLMCKLFGVSPLPTMNVGTYGIIIAWLTYIGLRAHSRKGFGGRMHCKHHDDPSSGPYSFSGFPERLCCIVYSQRET